MTAIPAGPQGKARVLYVEDHYESGIVVSRMLANWCDVVVCRTAADAHAALGAEVFKLVLLDINLGSGDGDGIRILRAIRALPAYAGVPVIAVTAYALEGDNEFFLAQGFSDYVSKPVNMTILVSKVRRLLGIAN